MSGGGAHTDRTETEFHSVFGGLRCVIALSETQITTRGGTSPGFAHDTENFLHVHWVCGSKLRSHNLPNERAKWRRRIQVTIVYVGGHDRTYRAFA